MSTRWPRSAACRRRWCRDNLKAGITKPSRYEPGINRTYQDLADHYGCVVLPARVTQAARQGQGGGRRPHRPALRAGEAAQPAVLLAGRVERRDPRLRSDHQRQGHAHDRQEPRGAFGDARPAGARCAAGASPTAMRNGSGARVAPDYHVEIDEPLLLGAVAADPRDRRGAHHRHDGRGPPQGPAASRATPARPCRIGTRPLPSTCRARTAATPNGRRPG